MPEPKAPQAQPDPWEQAAAQFKASGAPAGTSAPNEDWKLWQQGAQTQKPPMVGGFGATLANVGTHLKNMVTGPLHAAFDAPDDPTEVGLAAGTSAVPGGKMALGLYRALAKPTVDAASTAVEQHKKGNNFNKDEYDAQGNYQPSAFSSAVDAIPVVGPWARNIENDAHQKGMVPALAGLGTDIVAPKLAKVAMGGGMQAAGKGGQLLSANAPSLKLAATRFLVPGKPGELLQSALKPGVKYGAGVADTLESSLPHVMTADPALNGVAGFARASDAAKDAAYQPYSNIVAPYRPAPGGIGPVRPGSINGAAVGDAIEESVPPIDRFESPRRVGPSSDWTATRPNSPGGVLQNTAERAEKYRRQIPIATADALREDANAKLNAFYNKSGGDQNAALSSPPTAAVKAIGDSIRHELYPKLETDAGLGKGTIEGLQKTYGQLADVSDIANKREPVFARHDPVSLSQKVVSGHGNPLSMAWNYAVQKGLGKLTNSDALVNSAVDRFQHPEATPLAPRPGVLPRVTMDAGRAAANAGKAVKRIPLRANPLFYGNANSNSSRGRE